MRRVRYPLDGVSMLSEGLKLRKGVSARSRTRTGRKVDGSSGSSSVRRAAGSTVRGGSVVVPGSTGETVRVAVARRRWERLSFLSSEALPPFRPSRS